ncbi:MAG TPA: hypothetical protein VN922_01140 [Bacteroidia bacterium]|nr:hypothetical protein [Bacteroidia bacterium]
MKKNDKTGSRLLATRETLEWNRVDNLHVENIGFKGQEAFFRALRVSVQCKNKAKTEWWHQFREQRQKELRTP